MTEPVCSSHGDRKEAQPSCVCDVKLLVGGQHKKDCQWYKWWHGKHQSQVATQRILLSDVVSKKAGVGSEKSDDQAAVTGK